MIGIYKIENLKTNKCYIGQSSNIEVRWNKEYQNAFNPNSNAYNYPLSQDFRKYDKQNFNFEVLEECSIEELSEKEKYWIKYYDSFKSGYNQTLGGEGFHKISSEDLNNIINDLSTNVLNIKQISEKYLLTEDTVYRINSGRFYYQEKLNYPIRQHLINNSITIKHAPNGKCQRCNKDISEYACFCKDCFNFLNRKVKERPDKEELNNLLKNNFGNFSLIGKQYSVSDNTIRKWCKAYGLPTKSSEYKGYKEVYQYTLDGKFIQMYDSPAQASKCLLKNTSGESNIAAVCKGKRQTAYGFKWKYKE